MPPESAKPAANPLRRNVDREVVQAWLDALSTGACDEQEFLRAVEKLTRRSLDAGWDALALLDQYFRLGKIPAELFSSIKSRLGSQLIGAGANGQELSVPLPQSGAVEPPLAPAPAPVTPGAAAAPRFPRPARAPPARTSEARTAAPARPAPLPSAVQAIVAQAAREAAASQPAQHSQPAQPAQYSQPAQHSQPPPPSQPAPPPSQRAATQLAGVETLRRPTRREIAVGEVLRGRYVIKSVLGRGGTGMVFGAADLYRVDTPDGGQRVALKVLHGQIAGKPELLCELQREFQLLQSLSHPNIVRAHDMDRDGDIAFFTMEYLRGLSLTGVLAARNLVRFERRHALAIIRDVGGAVAHAHSRAVVHGDLNPGNIFITNEGEIRVLDFGAARVSNEGHAPSSSDRAPVATPRFASPQVLDGRQSDARDDLYSLACLSYVLLSGRHPFGERTALGAQEQRLRPSRPGGLNWKEWRALRAGLAFDRERRPADVTQWLAAFDWSKAAARLPPLLTLVRVPPRSRPRWAVPALGTAAVLAALAAALWAGAYFDLGRHAPWSVTGDSGTQSDGPPPQTDGSSAAAQPAPPAHSSIAPEASPQEQATPPARSSASQATPPAHSAPVPPTVRAAATATPTPPPSTPATARTQLAASSRSAGAVEAGALPRSRIELAADTIDVPLTDPAARIIVRRRGSLQGDATFTWWTESGTAKPGQDFIAVSPHPEVIEDGKNSVSLFIPVVGDATRQQPKSFYVVINDPGPGVTLGARTLSMVTIPPSQ
jgi:serine/threonine protein kinase